MPHPLFERHRATLDRALQAIAERGYWSAYPGIGEPQALWRRRGRGRQGRVRRAQGKAVCDRAARHRRHRRRREIAVRICARHQLSQGRPRPLFSGDRKGAQVAWRKRRPRGVGRRVPRDPAADQPQSFSDRPRGDAHDGTGVHDGVPGRRTARAGPRARSGRLRVGRDAADSRQGAVGKAAGQERAAADGKAVSHRAARHRPRHRLLARFRPGTGTRGCSPISPPATPSIVKPHPAAILPLAITVRIAREVLARSGLRSERRHARRARRPADDVAQQLALRPEVKLIDFTGSAANGNWLEANARQALVYTEKSGVNQIVIDSAADFKGARAQRRIFARRSTPARCAPRRRTSTFRRDGIDTAEGHLSFDEVAQAHRRGRAASCWAIRRARSRSWAPSSDDGVAKPASRAPARWDAMRARHAGDRASAVPAARRSARPLIVKLDAAGPRQVPRRNGSVRSRS